MQACGTVVNAVGWVVPDVRVKAVGVGLASVRDNHLPTETDDLSALTNASGVFTLLLRKDAHALVFTDTRSATDPERGGAQYAPTEERVSLFGRAPVAGACGGSAPAINMSTLNERGPFVLKAPGQGFVQASVKDGAAKTQPLLAHVDVALTATLDARDATQPVVPYHWSLHAHTDAAGVARLACQSPSVTALGPQAPPTPYTIVFSKVNWTDAQRPLSCREGALASVDVLLWRRPVTILANVTNTTDLRDEVHARAGQSTGQAPVGRHVPVPNAAVGVSRGPSDLGLFAASSPLCQGADPHHLVSLTNASPYACADVTGPAGTARLALPWSNAADGYALAATSPPFYGTTTRAALLTEEDVVAHQAATAPRQVDFELRRPTLTLTQTVANVTGSPVAGVVVTFTNHLTSFETAPTPVNGTFTTPIEAGPWNVEVEAPGYNARGCRLDVEGASGAASVANLTPANCFRLIAQGKSLVTGVVRDAERSVVLANAVVCTGGVCTNTSSSGVYNLELPAGSAFSIQTHPSSRWAFTAPRTGSAPAADGVSASVQSNLARKTVHVTINATDGNGAGIPGVDVVVKRGATVRTTPPTNVTDASGSFSLDLEWSRKPGQSAFDSTSYTVTVKRHRSASHFVEASAAFDVSDSPMAAFIDVVMTPEGKASLAVTVTDAHTGLPVGASVTASPVSGQPEIACGTACSTTAPGSILLYPDHVYSFCATFAGYAVECGNHWGGTPYVKALRRNATPLATTVLDAHTGLPVGGLTVRAVHDGPGFTCAATAAFVCQATTSAQGVASLTLPWTAPAKMCLEVVPGSGTITLPASEDPAAPTQEQVGFQAARACQAIPVPGATPATLTQTLRVLRAPTPAIAGPIANGSGEPLPADTRVRPTLDRQGFTCDPADHDAGADIGFPHCAGVAPSAGRYSLSLPAGGLPNHTWSLTTNASGLFDEVYTEIGGRIDAAIRAPGADLPALRLWARQYNVTVRIEDRTLLGDPHPCSVSEDDKVYVVMRDVDGGVSFNDRMRQGSGGACEATVNVTWWNRDTRPMPVWQGPWNKESVPYVLEVIAATHVGANFSILGPAQRLASITMAHPPQGDEAILPGVLMGTIRDGNATDARGVGGAQLTAVRQGGGCHGTGLDTFRGFSGPDGRYEIRVGCAGTYLVGLTHSGLYRPVDAALVALADDPHSPIDVPERGFPVAVKDFTLERTLGQFRIVVSEIGTSLVTGLAGVRVDPLGLDVTKDPAHATTDAEGAATFANLPWGAYTVTLSGPTGYVHAAPSLTVLVLPEQSTEQRGYAVRT